MFILYLQDMKAAPYFLRICQIISKSIDKVLLVNPNTEITSSALGKMLYFKTLHLY